MVKRKVHAEIEYAGIHSDVCPPGCDADKLTDPEYRKYIHDLLDEWLDNSKGLGCFYLSHEDENGYWVVHRGQNEKANDT